MATERGARRVFLGLILISIVLLALVGSPFFEAFFLAAVLAEAFQSLQTWLARHLRGHAGLSAGVICVGVVLVLLAPIAGLAVFMVSEIAEDVHIVNSIIQQRGLEGLLAYVPGPVKGPASNLIDSIQTEGAGLWQPVQELLSARPATAAKTVGGVAAATGSVAVQGTIAGVGTARCEGMLVVDERVFSDEGGARDNALACVGDEVAELEQRVLPGAIAIYDDRHNGQALSRRANSAKELGRSRLYASEVYGRADQQAIRLELRSSQPSTGCAHVECGRGGHPEAVGNGVDHGFRRGGGREVEQVERFGHGLIAGGASTRSAMMERGELASKGDASLAFRVGDGRTRR